MERHVIMPNHLHGIILVGAQFIASLPRPASLPHTNTAGISEKSGVMNHAPTQGNVVRAFKAISTRRIRTGSNSTLAWQRNYYEHVIRDEAELHCIRQYITNNPMQWEIDRENPHCR
jgi:REP element-mobilizing transposase RayT